MTDNSSAVREVLRRADEGDRQPLFGLLESYRVRLRRLIQLRLDRRLQGRIDASDVIQEAYLEASSKLDDYLGDQSMPPYVWLRFLTVKKLAALHRRHLGTRARDAQREISLYRGPLPEATSEALAAQLLGRLTSPSMAVQRAEQQLRLQDALESMDFDDREVLLLRHFEELSNHETAQVLGISSTAACNRHVRALKRLKAALTNMPGGIDEIKP